MDARPFVQPLDEFDGIEFLTVERDRIARLELEFEQLGLPAWSLNPLVYLLAGNVVWLLEFATLDRAAPEVRVDTVLPLVAALDRQAALVGVRLFPLAGQSELANWRDDLHV